MRHDRGMDITVTSADGTRLEARRSGRGEPMVLVHGTAGGLDSWDPVVPFLEDAFELWVYARRGYAPSGGCERAKTFADDVADLRAVVAAAGGEVGIRTLIVFEPPLFAGGAVAALDGYRAALAAGEAVAANRMFAAEVARVPAVVAAGLGAAPADEAVGMLHDLEALAADSADVARWGRIGIPVRIVQGSDTWAPMPETMDALAVALPGAERIVLEGQSHFATHTAPEMFAGALR